MANVVELAANTRVDMGKGASRRLRRAKKVPAVMYGGGKEPQSLEFHHDQIWVALGHESTYSRILTINIDNSPVKAVLKDVQRHPYRSIIMHMDLQRINENEKLHMHVPLHFLHQDVAPGVKAGGIVSHLQTDLEVVCLPKDLPEYIEIDVANLGMDEVIHVSHLKLPAGVESVQLNHGNDISLVSIHRPRVVEEVAPTAAAAPAEGEEAPAAAPAAAPEKK